MDTSLDFSIEAKVCSGLMSRWLIISLLLALGARRGVGFGLACLAAAVLVPLLAVFAPIGLWVGIAQRLAFLLWFAWWLLASRASR